MVVRRSKRNLGLQGNLEVFVEERTLELSKISKILER